MRLVFAGGGTGGHLFPGIALAQENDGPSLFLCTTRPFDAGQLRHYGFDHKPLDAPRLPAAVRCPIAMVRAVAQAAKWLRAFRADALIGVGGYGSAPALVAAKLRGIPYALLEQNARPGRTNRWAARGAWRVYGQWPRGGAELGSRYRHTGSPLRRDFRPIPREEARARYGLDASAVVVGVVGGSQGAQSLNALVLESWKRLNGERGRVTFLHLAGPAASEVSQAYRKNGLIARVLEFERHMGAFYSACDFVVSRAGGMAIAELAAAGAAAALVPYPHAAEDHQRLNANALEGAAWVVEEPSALAGLISKLVSGDPSFNNKARSLARFARPEAGRAILGDLSTWL
ncbi:MAG: UDP-N-acetylglucosamine--N-acetylmuramyl-(pentapeptide) pyrophosphoryl-undecaprenol N-acetylglucosamine transferase [Planctomycetes bacterium]|nr:UDP-N-acetylglucosamine--N-acetylmuramyl-(pentapeptide) pyrophosphoryl-undecaprenol N-acetylglucosamine transferase [Planctomycetota bacterium]